ncbi:carboxypeptidase-like regulatory domain-containing protein [Lacibacter sp.]|uniref:carboxypeptidase-like regulatory domain-containing protein n=1 Tax=Lacibacter sp. TaxID=1915409 RepID=UPI002B4B36D9|nr:carboxypeptidase-like regulatory domain-containing protein [Lacibacter sp.]HLP39403.1 carboxypeptidase-like regulatory domain-containing protein [Lacibacter sp.]
MSEKLYLSIADPCHEDWNKMTPVERGRFCSSCQKNVVDFTTQSDEEIISFFNNYNGTACGRFTDDQLDRPIQKIELKPASSFLKYAAGLMLPAFLFATKAKGQFKERMPKVTCEPKQINIGQALSGRLGGISYSNEQPYIRIKGQVIDQVSKEPLGGVSVLIKGTNLGVATDSNGKFTLQIHSKSSIVQYSSIGYETIEIKASDLNKIGEITTEMKAATMDMSGVVVVGYTAVRKGGVGGAVAIRTSKRISLLDSLLPAKVKIYPNPVAASGTINVSFPNVKPGLYQLRLLSVTGQLVYSFQKQISGRGETEQIHLSENIVTGIYYVQVLDEQKKLIQTTKISIQ